MVVVFVLLRGSFAIAPRDANAAQLELGRRACGGDADAATEHALDHAARLRLRPRSHHPPLALRPDLGDIVDQLVEVVGRELVFFAYSGFLTTTTLVFWHTLDF